MKKYLIVLVLVLIIGFLLWQVYLPIVPTRPTVPTQEVIFNIEKGESSKEISQNLEKEELIRWGPIFRLYVLTAGNSQKLQAGTYSLSKSMNIPQIVRKFTTGDVIKEKITIIEGWNLRNIGFYFENKGMFQAEELWELVGFPLDLTSREGYLFPDTYEINAGEPLEEIVKKMQDNFEKKTIGLKEEIEKQNKTLSEIITMASLIEKEVRTKEDKEIVSGIFWKRIKYGKPLESCASIAYIKGEDLWRYSYEDTRIKSPYNTYLNYGLPAGPICNPGLESIEAAIHPKDSQYWYWLSTPEGEIIFSKTLKEHNYAKSIYLK